MKHQPVRQGQTTTPGIPCPTLFDKCLGSLTFPSNHKTLKMRDIGPTLGNNTTHMGANAYLGGV